MKNMIIKTAMMAAITLTLIVGSAFADEVSCVGAFGPEPCDINNPMMPYLWGEIGFTGSFSPEYETPGDYLTMYAMTFHFQNAGVNSKALLIWDATQPNGVFGDYIPPSPGWDGSNGYPQQTAVPNFPDANGLQFRGWDMDEDGNRISDIYILDNVVGFAGGVYPGFFLGEVEGFQFYITQIVTYTPNYGVNGQGIYLEMDGYVFRTECDEDGDNCVLTYRSTPANYALSTEWSERDASWRYSFGVKVDGTPEVPEPGTLVLLGTGLLGAAIVARRKINKK